MSSRGSCAPQRLSLQRSAYSPPTYLLDHFIFSIVYGVLLRPLPYPEADRIVTLEPIRLATGRRSVSSRSPPR